VPIYLNESRFAAASAVAERLARLNPDDIEAQRIDLRTLVIIGDNDAAAPLGRKLLALSPEDAEFLNLNGVLERKAGDYPAARDHLEKALALNPNDYNSRIDLGSVLAELKDNAGAREQFEKAIKLGANKPQVYFELAKALRALGEAEEARRQLEFYKQRVKENDETTAAMLRETEAAGAAKAGDNRKAAELYGEASAAQPHDARLAYRLALALGELGDIAGERAALERAIQADPNFVSAQYQLGYLDSREGDNAAAEKQFRLVVEAAPGNLQGWISLAAILGNESRFQEAQEALENALRLEPDSASALTLSRRLAAEQGHL
jgi:Flp pilus assembly protein TadD